jgi:lipopolysaccharide exporter
MTLTRQVAKSALWNGLTQLISAVSVFAGNIVLMGLLETAHFGLMSYSVTIMSLFSQFQDFGFKSALIQRKDKKEEAATIAFFVNITLNIFFFTLVFISAPAIAGFFNETDLIPVLRVVGVSFILVALGGIHETLLRKDMDFQKILYPEAISTVVQFVVAITLGFMGFGVWSLVYGTLVKCALKTIMLWYMKPWKPRLFWDIKVAWEMFHFGKHVFGISFFLYLIMNGDYWVVGKLIGTTALGIYTMAFKLSNMPATHIAKLLTSVLYPAYSRLQDDRPRLGKAWLRVLRLVFMTVLPVTIYFIVLSPIFVRGYLDEKWDPMVTGMIIFAFLGLTRAIGMATGDLFKSIGRPNIMFRIVVLQLFIMILLFWYMNKYVIEGKSLEYAIAAFSLAVTLAAFVGLFLVLYNICRLLSVRWLDLLKALAPSFMAGAVMIAALFGLYLVLINFTAHPYAIFFWASIPIGAIAYLAPLVFGPPKILQELKAIAASR